MKKLMLLVVCAVIVAGVGLSYGCKKETTLDKAKDTVESAGNDASKAVDDLTK